jgi:small subunit ribosomal protein S1
VLHLTLLSSRRRENVKAVTENTSSNSSTNAPAATLGDKMY